MKIHHQCWLGVVLFAAGWVVSPATGDAQTGTLIITQADNGTTVNAAVGQTIEVDLQGNPSVGDMWLLTTVIGDSVVTNGPMVIAPNGPVIGGSATFGFPFVAAQPGDTALTFDLQTWSGTPILSFAVTVHIPPAPCLSIMLARTNVVVSWPMAGSTNFFLEGATSLAPSDWAALNVLPLANGTNYTVTLGAGGGALYFRLHQP